jgi:hypothetical protein
MVWVNELRVSVLDCGSPLPLFHHKAGDTKRQRAAAVQNLAESSSGFQSAATFLLNRSKASHFETWQGILHQAIAGEIGR